MIPRKKSRRAGERERERALEKNEMMSGSRENEYKIYSYTPHGDTCSLGHGHLELIGLAGAR